MFCPKSSMKFVQVGKKNRKAFDNLFNLYLHDLSEFNSWIADQLNNDGIYINGITNRYFNDETVVYLIYYKEKLAGFICLSWGSIPPYKADYMIQELFILRPYRKTNLARRVVREIFRKYPGKYSLHVLKYNMHAHRFWRKCITTTGADFSFYWFDEQQDSYVFEIKPSMF